MSSGHATHATSCKRRTTNFAEAAALAASPTLAAAAAAVEGSFLDITASLVLRNSDIIVGTKAQSVGCWRSALVVFFFSPTFSAVCCMCTVFSFESIHFVTEFLCPTHLFLRFAVSVVGNEPLVYGLEDFRTTFGERRVVTGVNFLLLSVCTSHCRPQYRGAYNLRQPGIRVLHHSVTRDVPGEEVWRWTLRSLVTSLLSGVSPTCYGVKCMRPERRRTRAQIDEFYARRFFVPGDLRTSLALVRNAGKYFHDKTEERPN